MSVLGLPPATYYRWQERAYNQQLTDRVVVLARTLLWPTPAEVAAVCAFARTHPRTGYKRLAAQMLDANVACLLAHQVYYREALDNRKGDTETTMLSLSRCHL